MAEASEHIEQAVDADGTVAITLEQHVLFLEGLSDGLCV